MLKTDRFQYLFLFRGFFVNFPFKGQGGRSGTSSPAVGKASRSNETTWSELVRLSGQAVLPLPQLGGSGRIFIRRRTLRLAFGFLGPATVLYKENPCKFDGDISHALGFTSKRL